MSKSDISEVMEIVGQRWPSSAVPGKARALQVVEIEENSRLILGDLFAVKMADGSVLPFLGREELLASFPSVTVDMGAVKFVCNGADVMRPGIVKMDAFRKDDIVVVKEASYGKYLAVGLALADSEEAEKTAKGAVVKNKHHISDRFWNAYKEDTSAG